MGGDIFSSRSGFLKSGQLITGSTSLLYKGSDGTSRIINPDKYQPKGSYAAANHSHNGANLSFDSTRSLNDVINNNYSMIVNANNEISSLKSSVSNGKSLIASAITDKGVSTASDATFQTMSNNIRSITSISSPKLIPGNILWSVGTTNAYGNPEYPAYTPPIFEWIPNMIIVGHKIFTGYNTITGLASTITGNYHYYFYNIITGSITDLFISEYSFTGAIPNTVKNGDPYLLIFVNQTNSPMYDHKVIRLE